MRITLDQEGNRGFITGPFSAHDINVLRDLPDSYKWHNRIFYFKKCSSNIEYLQAAVPDAEWVNDDYKKQIEMLREMERDAASQRHQPVPALPPEGYAFKRDPFQHQLKALALSRDKAAFGYFMDMGCVDSDTEYLSPTGWKRIADYDGGMVTQFNMEDYTADLVDPLGYLEEDCFTQMYRLRSPYVDQLLTPGHQLILRRPEGLVFKACMEMVARGEHQDCLLPYLVNGEVSWARIAEASIAEEHPSEQKKYCFEVPTGALVLRRNGKVFVTGNTGKSFTAINHACYLFLREKIDIVLVIAPNGVHRQWIREQLPDHVPDNVPWRGAYWESGKKIDPSILEKDEQLRVLSINVESMIFSGGEVAEKFLKTGRALIILDESSRIKNPKAKRTKAVLKLRDSSSYRLILSGTPITQGIQDLYTQFSFLDPDILGFTSFFTFRNRFCKLQQIPNAPAGAVKITGYQNVQELIQRVEGHTFRVTKDECLDLPPKLYTTREVDLTPEQRKMYVELRDDFFTFTKDGKVVDGALAITRMMKMQQVLCGFLKLKEEDDDGNETTEMVEFPTNRVNVCVECVEESPRKVQIWARFHYDIDNLHKALKEAGFYFVKYDGRMSAAKKEEAIRVFREDPNCKGMIAQQDAGGIGLNLAVADTVIYYSNTFNAETRWQSEDRTHRIGQQFKVTYIDLVVRGTIDVQISKALREKKNVAELVLDPKFVDEMMEPPQM